MFGRVQYFLITLLCILEQISCNDFSDGAKKRLKFLSESVGFCSGVFQYLIVDDFIIGKLTLPDMKMGDTVKLEFYYETLGYDVHFRGSLLLDDSTEEILQRLQNGLPISYRVDFPLSLNTPRLESIFINDNEYCPTIFKRTGEKLILEHTLQIKDGSLPIFKYNIYLPYFNKIPSCGFDNKDVTSRAPIANNETNAQHGEYPWLSAIFRKQGNGLGFLCSGALVSSRFVLTTAQCFSMVNLRLETIQAHLGQQLVTDVVVRDIETVIIHPEYKPQGKVEDADLALLQMQEPVSFTQNISPICLWSEPDEESLIVDHSAVLTTWSSAAQPVPKKIRANIISKTECLRSAPIYSEVTSARTLCAEKFDNTGPCLTRADGNLMIKRNGRWMLRAVISSGQQCNLQKYSVFCDVAKHTTWLHKYIEHEPQAIGTAQDVCGLSAGTTARTAHPWLAALYRKLSSSLYFMCTGALISSTTILAPASCLLLNVDANVDADDVRVSLGRYDLADIMEHTAVTRDIEFLQRHPNFEKKIGVFYDYDLALLQMTAPVSFTQYIKPICLWSGTDDQSAVVGQTATLTSWDFRGILNETMTVPEFKENDIVPLRQCISIGFHVLRNESFLCSPRFGNNIDGLLMLKRNERWFLRGISTANFLYSDRFGKLKYRLYTDVSEYLPWIQKNL